MDLLEIRAVVASKVDKAITPRRFTIDENGATYKVYIRGGSRYLDAVDKVNRLTGDTVHLVVALARWERDGREGVNYFLQSIERVKA